MKQDGADGALILGPPVHPAGLLLGTGFLPLPPAQQMIFLPVTGRLAWPGARRMHLHWR